MAAAAIVMLTPPEHVSASEVLDQTLELDPLYIQEATGRTCKHCLENIATIDQLRRIHLEHISRIDLSVCSVFYNPLFEKPFFVQLKGKQGSEKEKILKKTKPFENLLTKNHKLKNDFLVVFFNKVAAEFRIDLFTKSKATYDDRKIETSFASYLGGSESRKVSVEEQLNGTLALVSMMEELLSVDDLTMATLPEDFTNRGDSNLQLLEHILQRMHNKISPDDEDWKAFKAIRFYDIEFFKTVFSDILGFTNVTDTVFELSQLPLVKGIEQKLREDFIRFLRDQSSYLEEAQSMTDESFRIESEFVNTTVYNKYNRLQDLMITSVLSPDARAHAIEIAKQANPSFATETNTEEVDSQ